MPTKALAKPSRRDMLNIRITPDESGLIDRAAELAGKTRADFVLEAARRAAVETLTDRILFAVDAVTCAKFEAALDDPPHPNEALRRTMQATPPWDTAKPDPQ